MRNPWWVTIVCGMASFIDACAIIGSGSALVLYQHSIGTTPDRIGILSFALTLCIAFGALTKSKTKSMKNFTPRGLRREERI